MTTKHEKDNKNVKAKESLKKVGIFLLGLLFTVNTIQLARFGDIVERVDRYNQGVVDELGGFRNDVVSFGTDLNEIREFLLLPTKEYSFMSNQPESTQEGETEGNRTESALYAFLQQMSDEQNASANKDKAIALANEIHNDADFLQSITAGGMTLGNVETNDLASGFKVNDQQGNGIFAVNVDLKKAKAFAQSALGSHHIEATDSATIKKELISYMGQNKDQAIKMKTLIAEHTEGMKALKENNEIKKILADKKGTIEESQVGDEDITYPIFNSDKEKVLEVKILRKDGSIQFEGKSYNAVSELLQPFIDTLKNTDFATAQEQLINGRKAELEAIFKEEAFRETLKSAGWTLSETPREDYNKLLYDVKAGDKVVFSFAIEMSSGSLKIIKADQEIDLYSFLSQGSKKKP